MLIKRTMAATVAALILLSSCKKTQSDQENFRASRGWFFAKEHAALYFVPYSLFAPNEPPEGLRYCGYYATGDAAVDGKFDYMNITKAVAEKSSRYPFSVDDLFLGMLDESKTNQRMAQLTMNWARGSSSLAGDFLSEHKGKIEGTVVAAAVTAASVAVLCTMVLKSSPKNCTQILPKMAKFFTPENLKALGEGVEKAKELSPLPGKLLNSKAFRGIASFLTFALSFVPGNWANWVSDQSDVNESNETEQMIQLSGQLSSQRIQDQAEERLVSILESLGSATEEVHWDDLKAITAITTAAGKSEEANQDSNKCPRPCGPDSKPASCQLETFKPAIAEYFKLKTGWAK